MALEPLTIAIRTNKELKGIQTGNKVMKIGMYADDVVCYLSNPVLSIKALSQIIEEFGPISGYKIIQDKSILSGFSLTDMVKREIVEILPGKWQNENIRFLGIRICRTNEEMVGKI